jgi:hypothetical protein
VLYRALITVTSHCGVETGVECAPNVVGERYIYSGVMSKEKTRLLVDRIYGAQISETCHQFELDDKSQPAHIGAF